MEKKKTLFFQNIRENMCMNLTHLSRPTLLMTDETINSRIFNKEAHSQHHSLVEVYITTLFNCCMKEIKEFNHSMSFFCFVLVHHQLINTVHVSEKGIEWL